MASNYTTNYQLNQWEAGDQVLRTEFNQDNQKIDRALKTNAETIAAEVAAREALAETMAVQGAPFSVCYGNGSKDYGTPSWSGNSVTITVVDDYRTDFICNASGKSYFLIALTEAG